jgi:TonB C terminal
MDEKRPLEVSIWHGEPRPIQVTRASVARQWPIPTRLLGIIGTVLLHGLVVQTVVLGTSTRKVSSPTAQGLATTANAAGAESEMTLVVVQPIEAANSKDNLFEEFISRGSLLKDLPIALISPDSTPALSLPEEQLNDNTDAESPANSGDPAGQARLFGIYSGQIQARIDRVWRRPRTPVNENRTQRQGALAEEAFRCQVRIIQDNQGNVQEILLPQCNGSAAWQRSLVIAIQQASPLPAPPSPTVFTNALTMTFAGFEYRPDSPADDYEIEVSRMQVQNGMSPSIAQPGMIQDLGTPADERGVHALRAPTDEPPRASSDSQ